MTSTQSYNRRKELMQKVRAKNSKAELMVFRYLRSNNTYFQKHYQRAIGTPDIALPRKKLAVFIDGDFWHGRKLDYCLQKYGEDGFWTQKIRTNIARDIRQRTKLLNDGWRVLAIWESDLKRKRTRDETLLKVLTFLSS